MSIAHDFMSILIHRAQFMSIARMSYAHKISPMYELCSYYDNDFIIDELCYIISSMTFIMTPTVSALALLARGVRYIDEKLSQADKSVFLKLSAITDDDNDNYDSNYGYFDDNDDKNYQKAYKYYDSSAKMYQF